MEVLARNETSTPSVTPKKSSASKGTPRPVCQTAERDLELEAASLRPERINTPEPQHPLVGLTRDAWERIDAFVTDNRTIRRARIGLDAPAPHRFSVDEFAAECEEMSSLYRDIFLDPKDSSPETLQMREFSRGLHAQFEECLLVVHSLRAGNSLNDADFRQVLVCAHGLRTQVGQILIKMESFSAALLGQ